MMMSIEDLKREHIMNILIHGYNIDDVIEQTGLDRDHILELLDMRDKSLIEL